MKKFLSLMLSLCLLASLSVQAFAVGDSQSSDVLFQSDVAAPDVFNVIVPAEIPIYMGSDGRTQVSQTLAIENKSSRPVVVEAIQVNGNDDWQIRDFSDDLASVPANTHDLALSFRGDATDSSGRIAVRENNWGISSSDQLLINTVAKLPLQTYAGRSSIATVIWTIDWYDGDIENPDVPADKIVVSVRPGDHGAADVDEIEAGSDGRLPGYPGVKPDDGYLFDHWEDQDGNPVDENTVFVSGDVIRPVFRPDPDYVPGGPDEPDVPVDKIVVSVLPGDHGTADVDEIEAGPDGRLPEYPGVSPDDGYLFDHWEDQDGNPVDENTEFKPGDSIKPVFRPDPDYVPGGPDEPDVPSDKIVIPVLPGDHGMADVDEIEAGSDGRLPEYPGVKPDDGYLFDHWEDQDGNSVDEDTEFKPGDSIKPVFRPDPDYSPDVPDTHVTVIVLPGAHGGASVDEIQSDDNHKISEYPDVTADDGYVFIGWQRPDGTAVDEDTIFEDGDEIIPVFEEIMRPVTITVLPGAHGGASVDKIQSDDNHKIPEYPGVTADDGYMFVSWQRPDGTVVDEDTVFEDGDEIIPVFSELIVVQVLPGDGGRSNVTSITATLNGTLPAYPSVSADTGYEFSHWVDASGTRITLSTVFKNGDSIKPVFMKLVKITFVPSQYNGTLSGNTEVFVSPGRMFAQVSKPTTNPGTSATFMGWYIGSTEVATSYSFTQDTTVTAKFESWFTHSGSTVTGFSSAYEAAFKPSTIVIPSTIDGTKMTTIGDSAFSESVNYWPTNVRSVTLESGYTSIGYLGFSGFTRVTSMKLPSTLKTISKMGLMNVGIKNGSVSLGSLSLPNLTSVGDSAFNCCLWESITIPDGCYLSSSTMFGGSPKLKRLDIGTGTSNFTYICQNCPALETVYLPRTTSTLSSGSSFYGCSKLKTIYIDKSSGSISGSPWGSSARVVWTG